MNIPLLLTAGLAAGAVNAIAGGGSLITFPALVAAGLSPLAANVTNSIAVCSGYLASVVGSRQDLDRRLAIRLAPAAVLGAATGSVLLLATPAKAFEVVVPFLVLAASLALLIPRRQTTVTHPVVLHGVVFGMSIYGGYFGAALGVLMLAGLSLVVAETLNRINALKNSVSLVNGLITAVLFGLFGPVNWGAVALLAPATILGGYLGATLARKIPAPALRVGVVVFGVGVAGWLLIR